MLAWSTHLNTISLQTLGGRNINERSLREREREKTGQFYRQVSVVSMRERARPSEQVNGNVGVGAVLLRHLCLLLQIYPILFNTISTRRMAPLLQLH